MIFLWTRSRNAIIAYYHSYYDNNVRDGPEVQINAVKVRLNLDGIGRASTGACRRNDNPEKDIFLAI